MMQRDVPAGRLAPERGQRSRGRAGRISKVSGLGQVLVPLALVGFVVSCNSQTVIANFTCPDTTADGLPSTSSGGAGPGTSTPAISTFSLPWSTGFESGWCDFEDGRGRFAESGDRTREIVTTPVHSGGYAAAFSVASNGSMGQMRVLRDGQLPVEAYYGAWYFVPSQIANKGLWNLIHFQGDSSTEDTRLWDVSLLNNANGELRLEVYCPLFRYYPDRVPSQASHPPIPIGSWFHIEVYWKRATDSTGAFRVFQNGEVIFELVDVITDNSVERLQWYVGNLVDSESPIASTVYVDDLTMQATPSFL